MKNIGLKFGIDKCGVLAMKRRKLVQCYGIELGIGEKIGQIGEKGCKHLRVLEKPDICQKGMNKNIRKEYFKSLKATLKSKLNAKHVSQAINMWVVPTFQYSYGIIE